MTDGQYRALVAYLSFWQDMPNGTTIEAAMKDIGIADEKQYVISELWKCNWIYNDQTKRIHYEGEWEEL